MTSAMHGKLHLLGKITASLLLPAIPIGVWYYQAIDDRNARIEKVRSQVRIPNVQTVDDLMIEKCQPGDVVLFDRRCHKCAAGPATAFSCIVGKAILCNDRERGRTSMKRSDNESFEHIGIIVPGRDKSGGALYDPSNLLLLEATASEGIVARPLQTRLEMSQSRTVLLLPLSTPGERRNDEDYEPSLKTVRLKKYFNTNLEKFRDSWESESQKQNYSSGHATLGLLGALGYALGMHKASPGPVSPSAWLVASALQESGAAANISEKTALFSKCEDFLQDYRFSEGENTLHLRPGWKFMKPVVMRETSRS